MKKLIFVFLLLLLFPTAVFAKQAVDYTLPYPGILPDNPLYTLKVVRDQVIGLLISDPLKKAEYDLLQADKRLASGVSLVKEGNAKYNLAVTTISKGENYFDEGIAKLALVGKQGIDVKSFASTMNTAAQKHVEVLQGLENQVNSSTKQDLIAQEKRVEAFEKRVSVLSQ